MKKISISLFTILVIALATYSAFTTKKVSSVAATYEIWGITSTLDDDPIPSYANVMSAIRVALKTGGTSPYDFDGGSGYSSTQYLDQVDFAHGEQFFGAEPFTDFNVGDNQNKNVQCTAGANRVRIAYTRTRVSDPDTNELLCVKNGIYSEVDEV